MIEQFFLYFCSQFEKKDSKLNALSRVINSKNSLPILADFVFDINNGMLQLTASDSENVMTTQLELTDVDGYGRFAVGNHDLLEAVKGFSEQPITFDIDQQANIAKPRTSIARYLLLLKTSCAL